jgi:hypothetical protein
LPLGVIGLVHAMTARGPAGLNIPSRAYWMAPSRQGQVVELVRSYIWWLGVLLTGIALAVHLAVLGANAVNPPRLRDVVIVPLLVAAVAGIAAWAVAGIGCSAHRWEAERGLTPVTRSAFRSGVSAGSAIRSRET